MGLVINYDKLGKKIREERVSRNLTQEEFAELISISPTFMSDIENGKRKLGLKTLFKVASVLNLSIDYLIDNKVSNVELNKNEYLKRISTLLENKDSQYVNNCLILFEKIIEGMEEVSVKDN